MSVIGRQDRLLLGGLAVALIVVAAKPIRYLLDLARDVERSSGLALIPALLILTVVFLVHQQGKRQEARARAAAAEADARQAGTRAAEMERLVTFGQALGRSLDVEAIRDVVLQHLPRLSGSDNGWVLLRSGGQWRPLVSAAQENRRELAAARQRVAEQALVADGAWSTAATMVDGHLCLPLNAAGHPVGILGIPHGGEDIAARQRILEMAAALLAISLRNAQLFDELRENSLRDGLTGCVNRTHAIDVIDTELRRARRSQLPVSLIMFDLDHFKDINDRYGHLCGDSVLAAVGAKMREVLRGSDVKCRYGGEEFLVLLPETPIEGAKRVADTLRRELAELPVGWKGDVVQVTASFGVSVAMTSEVDPAALIARADAALYRAKDQGRNCVRLSMDVAVV